MDTKPGFILAHRFTFSAATLIQNQPTDAETWADICNDLERALTAARAIADEIATAEDAAGVRQ